MVAFMVGTQRWVWCRLHGSWRIPEQLDEAMAHYRTAHGVPSVVPDWLTK